MKTSLSLVKKVLLRILLIAATIIVLLVVNTYYKSYQLFQDQRLSELVYLLGETIKIDNQIIRLTPDYREIVRQEFIHRQASTSELSTEGWPTYYVFPDLQAESPLLNPPGLQAVYQRIHQALGDRDDVSGVQILYDPDYNAHLVVGWVEALDAWRVTSLPLWMVHEAAYDQSKILFLQALLVLVVTLLTVYIIMRYQLQSPLEQIRIATEAMSRGYYRDVTERRLELPLKLDNEIGLLATTFLEMANNIKDKQDDLEKTIEERTKLLKNANKALYALYSEQKRP